jgi:hypothetical protein
MNKTFKLTTLLLGFALIFGTSCGKYEEGPGISFRSKKARVANTWAVEKYIIDGNEQDLTNFTDVTFEFTKDGKYTFTYGTNGSEKGTWEFGDKKETIKTKEDGKTDVDESTIIKLKNKEFWTKEVENGITTEIHLKEK